MSITHQQIADRLAALSRDHSEAYLAEQVRISAERKSLMELCDGIGHIWTRAAFSFGQERLCAVCGKHEPRI